MSYRKTPNIFFGLTKYSETSYTTPLENQITESIAYLLSIDKALLAYFLNKNLSYITRKRKIKIRTQSQHQLGDRKLIPDIEIKSEDFIVFIENKVDSNLNANQIYDYLRIMDNHQIKKQFLLIITKERNSLNIKDKRVRFKRWIDIYSCLATYIKKKNKRSNILVKDFLIFMESKNMKPFESIKKSEINAWITFDKLRKKIFYVIDDIKTILENKKYVCSKTTTKANHIAMRFRPYRISSKKWNKKGLKKILQIQFSLDLDEEDGETYVWCSLNFRTSALYYERFIESSRARKRVYKYLEEKKFDIDNPRIIMKYECLSDIIDYRKGEIQKNAIVRFFINALNELEESKLLNIIYRNE